MSETITIQDELTINNLGKTTDVLRNVLKNCDEIVVDATSLKNIDVAAIQMLFSVKKECLEKGKNLILKTSEPVSSMLAFIGAAI